MGATEAADTLRMGRSKIKQHVALTQGATAKSIGAGPMTVALVVIVLNELFTLEIVNNTSGPFSSTMATIENIGGGALTIVVLGFLVLAGAVAMSFMDRF